MHAESGVNGVATPIGAPTWPPCVALSAGLAQVSGAHEPGVLGSQPESPGPQASTFPPPVTRQPSGGTHSGGGGEIAVHCPVPVSHCWQVGHVVAVWVWTHTPLSQPGCVQASLSVSVQVGSVALFASAVHWPLPVSHCWRTGQLAAVWVWTHTPLSQPGCVQALLSVSVLLGSLALCASVVPCTTLFRSCWQVGHVVAVWVWTHTPLSQPGCVQALLSVSVQVGSVALFASAVHWPVPVSHCWQTGQLVVVWVWTHTPLSQPGCVQAVLSVSVQVGSVALSASAAHWPVPVSHCWQEGQ